MGIRMALALVPVLTILGQPLNTMAQPTCNFDNFLNPAANVVPELKGKVDAWNVLEILLAPRADWYQPPNGWHDHDPLWQEGNEKQSADRWREVVDVALDYFDRCASQTAVPEAFPVGHLFTPADLDEELKRYVSAGGEPVTETKIAVSADRVSLAISSEVLASPSGTPAAEPVQIGLSQVVSAGQPGLMPSIAVNPSPKDRHETMRHWLIQANGLIIEPVGSGGKPETPIAASFDVAATLNNRRSAYDWHSWVASQVEWTTREYRSFGAAAVRRLIETYGGQDHADRLKRISAFQNAALGARQAFTDASIHWIDNQFVKNALKEQNFLWGFAIRARVSPNATYLPDVPDLASAGLRAWLEGRWAVKDWRIGLTGSVAASASGYPTEKFKTFATGSGDWNVLADWALGGAFAYLSKSLMGNSRLTVQHIGRVSGREGTRGRHEVSLGFSAGLEIPVSETISLAGSYRMLCLGDASFKCTSFSGISFSKAFTGQ
jgi:hypothetical protein